MPDTTFRIDVFASAAYGPGGSGEAQDYLGSLEVTTDGQGQVSLRRPVHRARRAAGHHGHGHRPAGQHLRGLGPAQGSLQAPTQAVRLVPGQPVDLLGRVGRRHRRCRTRMPGRSTRSWGLTLSVAAGTLTLSSTAGLTGSGDGTGSLSYSGPLSALNAALDGLTFTPPPGSHGFTTLSLDAQSDGAQPIQAQVQFVITDGVFVVTTTADSGPGSLRQAILDSNAATGRDEHDRLRHPGHGVQTIAPASPLPAITDPVLIDGTIAAGLRRHAADRPGRPGAGGSDPLTIASAVTVRGVAIDGFALGGGALRTS